jgi:hypothetical protein
MARSRRLVPGLAALALLGACGDEAGPLVRVVLRSEVAVPTVVDRVTVDIVASRTDAGATCVAVTRGFELTDPSALPLRVAFAPGADYRAWVAFRVTWLRGGTTVAQRLLLVAVPESGVRTEEVVLDAACAVAGCAADQQCEGGRCSASLVPDPFDPARADTSLSCGTVP